MSLTEELKNLLTQVTSQVPPEKMTILQQSTQNLIDSHIAEQALKVGDRAPHFTLPNAVGKAVALENLLPQGPVVISFYRGQWCPYCNLELRALQQALPQIRELGASLVAISPQTPDNTLSTAEKNSLTFEVLSDESNSVAKQFGLVYTVPVELRSVLEWFGVNLETYNGNDSYELPITATYVIDSDGIIVLSHVDPDYTKRLEPEDLITVLKNTQTKTTA